MSQDWSFTTRQIHSGPPSERAVHPRATPIYLSAGYVFEDFDEAEARFAGATSGYVYSRQGNPTVADAEGRLAALEGGSDALLVASGQAAVSLALLGVAGAGDHIVSSSSIYGGTRGLLLEDLPRLRVGATLVENPHDPEEWAAAIRPETKALFLESIPNARNDLVDIETIAAIGHSAGVPLIVDNTLATPVLIRPLEHSADLVVHSTSKFLTGNGTALGGALVFSAAFDWGAVPARYPHLTSPTRALAGSTFTAEFGGRGALGAYVRKVLAPRLGPVPSPHNAFALIQGIETLSVRVARQTANALIVAQWLDAHSLVESVDYSGLVGNPYFPIAERLLPLGQGSVFTFTLRGGKPAARAAYDAVNLFTRMTHLGDVRSLILHPRTTTHALMTEQELDATGVFDGTIRLAIGLEDPHDLVADLDQAFAKAALAVPALKEDA